MNLVEFEAKALLRNAGLAVPDSRVVRHGESPISEHACVIKAQVPFGGRGKQGLVLTAQPHEVGSQVELVRHRMAELGWHEPVLLLEEVEHTIDETYLAWKIDDVVQNYVFIFSATGGVDVESNQKNICKLHFDPRTVPAAYDFLEFFEKLGFGGRTLASLTRFAATSWRVFTQSDAHLLEINPLAITVKGNVKALDAKIVLDENAAPRHTDRTELYSAMLTTSGLTELERKATEGGLTFVELPGEIAVISGGAGLGMALIDMLADAGMPAANFVDTSGGSAMAVYSLRTELVFERAARTDVKAILMYLTVTASNIARHVRTLLKILDQNPPPKPLVIGLLCAGAAEREMTFEEAQTLFSERGYPCERNLNGVMNALQRTLRPDA